jgi:NADPH:quinone reductase-like Zn-dependent oxidoreductase
MKASFYSRYGSPDVLRITDIPKPVPGEQQILIRVHASTVNRTDCGFLRASPFFIRIFSGLWRPNSRVLGTEFSGVVEDAGKAVTEFRAGDRVFGLSEWKFGAHAEYLVTEASGPVTLIPSGFTFEQAAPLTEGAHYALNDIRSANVLPGQKVMVYGATGAIGSGAVQLLKHFGAEVTAVCNTRNTDMVRSLGADRIIDYEKEKFREPGITYDFIFDAVGKLSAVKSLRYLTPKGIYISTDLGFMAQNIFLGLITKLSKGKKVLFPLPGIDKKEVLFLRELAESGKFRPVIDRTYPLEQIADAFRYVETGQKTGNVVISI